jgi:hypothetical protein
MTPNDVITQVRQIVQDTRAPYRYSDIVLLGFINTTIKRMVVLRPDLFTVIGDIPVTANTVLQECPAGAVRLVEIFQVKNRDTVTETSRETLDQTYPILPVIRLILCGTYATLLSSLLHRALRRALRW